MDLFDNALEERFDDYAPLAARMRPRDLDEIVGQQHVLGPGRALRALISSGDLSSIVLWGPAGTGKTTLAHVIARSTDAHFEPMSAVASGVADVRKAIEAARDRLAQQGTRTVLFLDEIHRFNKAQQDALLPAVENGWIVLVGATTENPSFEVNSPLMSRSLLFRLEALSHEDIAVLLRRALSDPKRGLGGTGLVVDDDALSHIADGSHGDARAALNALEAAASMATVTSGRVDLAVAEEALQRRALAYDKSGDWHYDVISAFIKSMRGSDADAAVYWMARMLDAGEDPRFIARRIVIFASEDVGNADPTALQVAVDAAHALELVGLPEAKLNLAQAAAYMALAPKSKASARALWAAEADVAAGPLPVPAHLRDSHAAASRAIGAGRGYEDPHAHGGWVEQTYLPEELADRSYFHPAAGVEADLAERLDAKKRDGRVER
ncbi:MAG TPA: replication-associated recombination protein A [Actinomycetota bacterium]|nr:replication-associated recombination protein A [Actinomycetota bacterium]